VNLRNIAAHRINERMEGWDQPTQAFVPNSFVGRIEIADRFLSNFNKPLRRRMMFTRHDVVFPGSLTFRHPGTHDVYLIGQTRTDARGGNPYVSLTVCHLVTDTPGGSAGMATLYRKAPAGPANDPGWLVDGVVATAYADLEFRSSSTEADAYDLKTGNFFAFMPRTVEAEQGDRLELHGKSYRVVDVYPDSGFTAMRVDQEPDTRIDFVIYAKGARVYDKATHSYSNPEQAFNVTGVITKNHSFASWTDESESYVDLVIDERHIGFRPDAGNCEVEIGGRRRLVKHVSTQPGERQYLLRCY